MSCPAALGLKPGLRLAVQLVAGDDRHEEVGRHQTIVDWRDLRAVSSPHKTAGTHGYLLERVHSFDWSVDVTDVDQGDEPFHGRAVEKYCEGSSGTCRPSFDWCYVNLITYLAKDLSEMLLASWGLFRNPFLHRDCNFKSS